MNNLKRNTGVHLVFDNPVNIAPESMIQVKNPT